MLYAQIYAILDQMLSIHTKEPIMDVNKLIKGVPANRWWVIQQGLINGPYTFAEVERLLHENPFNAYLFACHSGLTQWQELGKIAALQK